jgi:hypothetical protein
MGPAWGIFFASGPALALAVPLGEGACDFAACAAAMRAGGCNGNVILQTARAADGDHAGALANYRDVWRRAWSGEHGAWGVEQGA